MAVESAHQYIYNYALSSIHGSNRQMTVLPESTYYQDKIVSIHRRDSQTNIRIVSTITTTTTKSIPHSLNKLLNDHIVMPMPGIINLHVQVAHHIR
jgi:hypothetical protein